MVVYVFGRNDRGQLGLNDTINRTVPTLLPNINNAVSVACGDGFTIVLRSDLTAVGFGTNTNGQLCQSNLLVSYSNPVPIPGLSNAVQVSAGNNHVLYLLNNGQVVGAGGNAQGQLGNNATDIAQSSLASMILLGAPTSATASNAPRFVTTGAFHSAVLLNNGSMLVCGGNQFGQCAADPNSITSYSIPQIVPGASNLVRAAAGEFHTVAVQFNGQVIGWGRNSERQLGLGNTTSPLITPQIMITSVTAGGGSSGLNMTIDAGQSHTVVGMSNGDVRVMGANDRGQLGLGQATTFAATPTVVVGISAFNVAAGRRHTIVLRNNSILYQNQILAWGDNTFGQMGDGLLGNFSTIPAPLLSVRWLPNAISEVSARRQALWVSGGSSPYHSAYIDGDGTAYMFGENGSGQLGDGTTTSRSLAQPIIIPNARQIALGQYHTILLDSTGAAHAFGYNHHGQLGNGTRISPVTTPVRITSGTVTSSMTIVAAACSGYHSTKGTHQSITMNESLPIVTLCTKAMDKCVFGVVSLTNENAVSEESITEREYFRETNDIRAQINAIGEGAIWVVDVNGPIQSGDYIQLCSFKMGHHLLHHSQCHYIQSLAISKV